MNKGCLLVLSGLPAAERGRWSSGFATKSEASAVGVHDHPCTPEGETDGISYHFVTQEQFDQTVEQGGAMEYARCGNGDCYGTPAAPVKEWREAGMDVVLEIDIQGYRQVKEKAPDALVSSLCLRPLESFPAVCTSGERKARKRSGSG